MEMLDFNAIQQPTWPLKLKDDAQTIVHLSYPSLELVDRMTALGGELRKIAAKKDGKAIRASFEVVAEVMNYNEDGFTFTADELLTKYRMSLLDMARFVSGYMEFLQEANNAKN